MDYSIVCLTETGLSPSVTNNEIFPEYYSVYRCDRTELTSNKLRKGGVLIAVNQKFNSELVFSGETNGIELIWVKVFDKHTTIYVCAAYIPPASPTQLYNQYIEEMKKIITMAKSNDNIFITGDFNLPNLIWIQDDENVNTLIPLNITEEKESVVIDTLLEYDLTQINSIPNDKGRFLDLIFCRDATNIECNECRTPMVNNEIHHKALIFDMEITIKERNRSDQVFSRPNFQKADFDKITEKLNSINWTEKLNKNSIEDNSNIFYEEIFRLIEAHVPITKIKTSKNPPWIDKNASTLKNKIKKQYKKYKQSKTEENLRKFLDLKENLKQHISLSYDTYKQEMQQKIISDPKNFYKHVNYIRKSSTEIPSTMHLNGQTATNKKEICEFFKHKFKSIYTDTPCSEENISYPFEIEQKFNFMPNICVDEDAVKEEINRIDEKVNSGPDKIPTIFLKRCMNQITTPLTILFNQSLQSGRQPEIWKKSFMIPIHKSGKTNDVNNYRGVLNQSAIPKMLDKIVSEYLISHLYQVISDTQHGFAANRSTITNIIEFTSLIIESIEEKCEFHTIYTDMTKAFDRVDIKLLLHKLKLMNCNEQIIQWLGDNLKHRKQAVNINGKVSDFFSVNSGIGQGSHCAPILFNLFINDMKQHVENSILFQFADDSKFGLKIQKSTDCLLLQNDINKFNHYCKVNKLELNKSKSKAMKFSRKMNNTEFIYKIDDEPVENVKYIKDLGFHLDNKLTFNLHIDKCIAKAKSINGFIFRFAKDFDDPYVIKRLFNSFVLPVIEYGCVVWSPYYNIEHTPNPNRIGSKKVPFIRTSKLKLEEYNRLTSLPREIVTTGYEYFKRQEKNNTLGFCT